MVVSIIVIYLPCFTHYVMIINIAWIMTFWDNRYLLTHFTPFFLRINCCPCFLRQQGRAYCVKKTYQLESMGYRDERQST